VTPRVLFVDCRDSFTGNLVRLLRECGADVTVRRVLDEADWSATEPPTHLVLSPGPGAPADATEAIKAYRRARGRLPVLGVCLGHQVLATENGVAVGRAPRARHGHADDVEHDGEGLFVGVPSPFRAARYHSLVAAEPSRSAELVVAARSRSDGLTMAVRRRDRPEYGVQFHPESFLTEHGAILVRNFLRTSAP
jgi:anthranilate synthase/aminodeoxychorismate synthase-like glutamine amidotransferase